MVAEGQDEARQRQPSRWDSFRHYISALRSKVWLVLVGVVFGILDIIQRYSPTVPAPPSWFLWALFVVSIISATFLAYRALHVDGIDRENRRIDLINASRREVATLRGELATLREEARRHAINPAQRLLDLRRAVYSFLDDADRRSRLVNEVELSNDIHAVEIILREHLLPHKAEHFSMRIRTAIQNCTGGTPLWEKRDLVLGLMRHYADGVISESEVRLDS